MPHNTLHGSGKSSFDLVDHERVFRELGLTRGKIFLDLGCGWGDYTIVAAEKLGSEGMAYGVDGWSEGIEMLTKKALDEGLINVKGIIADVTSHISRYPTTPLISLSWQQSSTTLPGMVEKSRPSWRLPG